MSYSNSFSEAAGTLSPADQLKEIVFTALEGRYVSGDADLHAACHLKHLKESLSSLTRRVGHLDEHREYNVLNQLIINEIQALKTVIETRDPKVHTATFLKILDYGSLGSADLAARKADADRNISMHL